MWQRKTFHDCASELRKISDRFRTAYLNRSGWDEMRRNSIMLDTSQNGVEILRTLALAIRSEQDYGLTTNPGSSVGVLKLGITSQEVDTFIRKYKPPYNQLTGFGPLSLRQALNKVAHADPNRSGFYVDTNDHDLLLSGTRHTSIWVAVLSIQRLCDVIESLPDVALQDH